MWMILSLAARLTLWLRGLQMLTVDFGTPSYEFTVNIFMYLIF
jgi:hypothetical protein